MSCYFLHLLQFSKWFHRYLVSELLLWQHSWQREAPRSSRQTNLSFQAKLVLASKSQQTRDGGTERYFPSHPAVVHSATHIFQVTFLQHLISTQYQVKNVEVMYMWERKKNEHPTHAEDKTGKASHYSFLFSTGCQVKRFTDSKTQWNNQDKKYIHYLISISTNRGTIYFRCFSLKFIKNCNIRQLCFI